MGRYSLLTHPWLPYAFLYLQDNPLRTTWRVTVALGLGIWNPTNAISTAPQQPLSLEQRKAGFSRRVGGYYKYSASVFSAPVVSESFFPLPGETFPCEKFVADDPALQDKCLSGVWDTAPFHIYSRMRYSELDIENREYVRAALTTMAKTGAKSIHGIASMHPPPGAMNGIR